MAEADRREDDQEQPNSKLDAEKALAKIGAQSALAGAVAQMKEEVKDYKGISVRTAAGRCYFQVYMGTRYVVFLTP